jgi:hypothetical protein
MAAPDAGMSGIDNLTKQAQMNPPEQAGFITFNGQFISYSTMKSLVSAINHLLTIRHIVKTAKQQQNRTSPSYAHSPIIKYCEQSGYLNDILLHSVSNRMRRIIAILVQSDQRHRLTKVLLINNRVAGHGAGISPGRLIFSEILMVYVIGRVVMSGIGYHFERLHSKCKLLLHSRSLSGKPGVCLGAATSRVLRRVFSTAGLHLGLSNDSRRLVVERAELEDLLEELPAAN